MEHPRPVGHSDLGPRGCGVCAPRSTQSTSRTLRVVPAPSIRGYPHRASCDSPGPLTWGPGPGLDPGRKEQPRAHGGGSGAVVVPGVGRDGQTHTHPPLNTGSGAGEMSRSRPQLWGPDNPCAGLFTAPPTTQGARGALIFGPSSLLGHRAKTGRAMGQHLGPPLYPKPPEPQAALAYEGNLY